MLRIQHNVVTLSLSLTAFGIVPTGTEVAAQSPGHDILVSSRGTHAVKRYDGETGLYLDDFIAAGAGGLNTTQEILIGHDGHFLVSGRFTNRILRFDRRSGAYLGDFSSGYTLNEPTKMAFGPDGDLYVAQWAGTNTVVRFDGVTGAFVEEVTPTLSQPMQPAWDSQGVLHVVSFGSRDVRTYENGALGSVVTSGVSMGGPVNLWFDGPDLFVIDWSVGGVRRFDAASGEYVEDFVTGMTNAEGYAHGPDGRLYLGDWGSHVVNAYDGATGRFDGQFISGGGLQNPNSLLFIERLPDFSLSASREALSVAAGTSATVEITVLPDRDLAFDEPVSLSCSGLPSTATCDFSSSSVVPGSDGRTSTLTIRSRSLAAGSSFPMGPITGAVLLLAIGAGVSALRASGRSRQLALACAIAGTLWVVACGSATEPVGETVEANVVVRGVSGSLDRSVTLSVSLTR